MTKIVYAKKRLGQHFLKDLNIAKKIVNSLTYKNYKEIIEIGPGLGVLTQHLFTKKDFNITVYEIDEESVEFLTKEFPSKLSQIIHDDFLKVNLKEQFQEPTAIIGNFPYNISSQIFFKIIENKDLIVETVCMIQKEVAERIASKPGNKKYGILSVLLQIFFDIEFLFTVNPTVFQPPPKVLSSVIRLKRNTIKELPCDEKLFYTIVKSAFNQRRKVLRNSLKSILLNLNLDDQLLTKRPEQLSKDDFVYLTRKIQNLQLI